MGHIKIINAFLIFSCTVLLVNTTWGQDDKREAVIGKWYTGEKKAIIEIYQCEDKYCGKIVWQKEPNDENGQPKVDKHNPEESLRARPLAGLDILTDFEYDADDQRWEKGNVYDPTSGKTYSSVMRIKGKELEVRGYIGFTFLGKTVVWTPVEDR